MKLPYARTLRSCLAVLLLFLVTPGHPAAADESGAQDAAAPPAPEQVEALHDAARAGDVDEVRRLLDSGIPVDAGNRYEATALSYAASQGHFDVVKLLVERDAEVDVEDTFYKSTPAGWAAYEGHADVVRFLFENGATRAGQVMGMAIFREDLDVLRAVLEAAEPDAETLSGSLAQAQQRGNEEVVALLEAAGAEPPPAGEVEVAAETMERFVGTYEVKKPFAGEGVIFLEDGVLTFRFEEQPPLALEPTAPDTFRAANGFPLSMTFEEGDPSPGFEYSQQGLPEPTRFARKAEDAPPEDDAAGEDAAEGAETAVAETAEAEGADADADESAAEAEARRAEPTGVAEVNWPAFRGPNAAGTAQGSPPLTWDLESGENVLFRVPILGRGHASPVIWGDRVFLATAVAEKDEGEFRSGLSGDVQPAEIEGEYTWKVMALDKHTGEVLWSHDATSGEPRSAHHFKATQANSTPATDGEIVVAMLGSEGLFAWTTDGELRWRKDLGDLDVGWFYDPSYEWGFSSSPILWDGKVYLQVDGNRRAFLLALDAATGEEVWRTERDNLPSWGTPTIVDGPEGPELVTNGSRDIRGYDPRTGEELWNLSPTGEITVATPVVAERENQPDLVYVAARYRPIQPVYAVEAGARGDISLPEDAPPGPTDESEHIAWWDPRGGVYIPTPVVYGDILYLVEMRGIVKARDAYTGEEHYKARLAAKGSTPITASPVAAGGHLYVGSEDGEVFVLRHGREFERVAVNELGEVIMATPAISGDVLYVRTLGHLVALGGPNEADSSVAAPSAE